jgi:hypothetical protein
VLCLLFHQGHVIRIDRSLPPAEQHGMVNAGRAGPAA